MAILYIHINLRFYSFIKDYSNMVNIEAKKCVY
jgi:hypothetical protein